MTQLRLVSEQIGYEYCMTCIVYYLVQQNEGILIAFSTPARSLINTLIESAGAFDFTSVFNDGDSNLIYTPMAYILFITFVVLMPILFITLLVSSH